MAGFFRVAAGLVAVALLVAAAFLAAFLRAGFRPPPDSNSRSDQGHRFIQRDGLGRLVLGDRGVDLAPFHIRAVAAGKHLDLSAFGMFTEVTQRARPRARERPALFLLGQQVDSAVEPDRENLIL